MLSFGRSELEAGRTGDGITGMEGSLDKMELSGAQMKHYLLYQRLPLLQLMVAT